MSSERSGDYFLEVEMWFKNLWGFPQKQSTHDSMEKSGGSFLTRCRGSSGPCTECPILLQDRDLGGLPSFWPDYCWRIKVIRQA